ncbi:MAG: acyl-ACP--UDP-N-acetylglucosamine O-acyltransferase [Candidatus Omnitrophica bacterium]|nr:acyl-ACP--UDP-N-acetylglucosamine O-acyltransferase [Candidatus Omnitrophota bacterium]
MSIHPTAIIGKNVILGETNEIGPHVIIEDGVRIGSHNKIGAGTYICAGTEIGDKNEIHMHVVIGNKPQDLAYHGTPTKTIIGNKNIFREFVTIHRGTKEGTATVLGDENFLMAYAHLAHNCALGNKIILVNNATLGGYCTVEDEAFLSGMIVVHQFSRIGRLSMISGLSAVNKDVPPFTLCGGRASIVYGLNVVGLRRAGIPPATRNEIKRAYKLLYQDGLNVTSAIGEIEKIATTPEVKYFVEFIRQSKRGICKGGVATEAKEYAIQGEDALHLSNDQD